MHFHAGAVPGAQLCSGLPWSGTDLPRRPHCRRSCLYSGHSCIFGNHFPADSAEWKHGSKRIPNALNYLSAKVFIMDELALLLQLPPLLAAMLGHAFIKHFLIHSRELSMAGVFQRRQMPSLALGVFRGAAWAEPGAQLLAGIPALSRMGTLAAAHLWFSALKAGASQLSENSVEGLDLTQRKP